MLAYVVTVCFAVWNCTYRGKNNLFYAKYIDFYTFFVCAKCRNYKVEFTNQHKKI